jgi:tetraacyldisaccharide 4'-kinase
VSAKILLLPLSQIYRAVVGARHGFYRNGFFASHDLGAPVVSVGNLTVGGTGKTPLVEFVARVLAEEGFRVCVLTRGYKRANPNERVLVSDGTRVLANVRDAGDEPLMLARALLRTAAAAAAVVADKNRAAAGRWARENLGATAFVLDDGFQHFQLKRDVDIVAVDATNPFGNRKLLPAGILREPLTNLRRADLVVVTRADLSEQSEKLKAQIAKIDSNIPILLSSVRIVGVTDLSEFLKSTAKSQNRREANKGQMTNDERKILAFCGLGNPESFFAGLRRAGFQLAATLDFADHHVYRQADVDYIERMARRCGAQGLLTTAKDSVKLSDLKFDLPCSVVEIEPVFDDESVLKKIIKSKIKGKAD